MAKRRHIQGEKHLTLIWWVCRHSHSTGGEESKSERHAAALYAHCSYEAAPVPTLFLPHHHLSTCNAKFSPPPPPSRFSHLFQPLSQPPSLSPLSLFCCPPLNYFTSGLPDVCCTKHRTLNLLLKWNTQLWCFNKVAFPWLENKRLLTRFRCKIELDE